MTSKSSRYFIKTIILHILQ